MIGDVENIFHKACAKRCEKMKAAGLKNNAEALLAVIKINPFQNPPPYEKLVGDLSGTFSRRINIQHRLIYQVLKEEKIIKILRMWTQCE